MWQQTQARAVTLWRQVKDEQSSPAQLSLAVGLGVFIGCSPLVGLHGWLAIGGATLLRLNRLYCFLGSRIANFLTLPWIILAEIELSYRFRRGVCAPLDIVTIIDQAGELFLDWWIGFPLVGITLAFFVGSLTWFWLRRQALHRSSDIP
ncbi:hypothetical protein BCY86_06565 [Pajaroellobacter abortibovis]|uniref:DUF2062 domain-containing protein n=1 Tax=Pajaroellobacter abortibovis TaxID=1882918 RepID=A0A1L6MY03_9BACT|nr:hypothetical protein BCY86_06565 [Pajaroellobacter abortibovis]